MLIGRDRVHRIGGKGLVIMLLSMTLEDCTAMYSDSLRYQRCVALRSNMLPVLNVRMKLLKKEI